MSYSIDQADDETYKLGIAIMAAEEWSEGYAKDPVSHAKLIKAEADLERKLRRFFREMASHAPEFVNWGLYDEAVRSVHAANSPYTVEVIVNDTPIDDSDRDFINVVFDELVLAATAGITSGETLYGYPIGNESLHTVTQRYARDQVAQLVGRRLDKNGVIVDNPRAKYKISNTTRVDIRESIKTSISLGENQEAATERLRKTIINPRRAELIAQTEAVNSFQGGVLAYGKLSGAVAKESQTVGAIDYCASYAKMGPVGLDYKYGGQFLSPAYHPRCRCGLRLIYQAELNSIK